MNHRILAPSIPKGSVTYPHPPMGSSYVAAEAQKSQSNTWSSSENNSNNSWNVNFNNGNTNNNKYNSNVVRPVTAFGLSESFMESIFMAYDDCCKGKRSSTQCVAYYDKAPTDLPKLAMELWSGTYVPTTSTCFLVFYPKLREVFAANFRDRIVHHWIMLFIEPLFEKRFNEQHNVSFNCRKGYGTVKAVQSAYDGIKRVTENYRKPAWIYRGDLVGFFMSIDKDIMWSLMEPFIQKEYRGLFKEQLLNAIKATMCHRPEENCVFNTAIKHWENLAPNKSLLRNGEGLGMPIGNLTTQQFANFYMSFFDEYVAYLFHGLNYHYVRFVDDFMIVCDDKRALRQRIPMMAKFLKEQLHLTLHKDKQYFQPATHGVQLVGSILKNGRTYLNNRTRARFMERVHGFSEMLKNKEDLTQADLERVLTVLNSYLGFCKGHKTYKIRKEILGHFGKEFYRFFYIDGHYERIKLKS